MSQVNKSLNLSMNEKRKKFICDFLRSKCLSNRLIDEIFDCGLTEEVTRKLELLGFTCEEIFKLEKALLDDDDSDFKESDDFCDCTVKSESTIKSTPSKESNYLKEHFSAILPIAMREIAMKKPYDPIEYLGQWLLFYRECEEREKRRREFEEELLEERLKWQDSVTVYIPSDGGESEGECESYIGI